MVVIGVAGAGKTTVGQLVADRLGLRFFDADDLHPAANIARMAAGHALDDDDRLPWLRSISTLIREIDATGAGAVVACSGLKRSYRDVLRDSGAQLVYVHLAGDQELVASRMASRSGHFMPASLTDSQYRDLEPLAPDELGFTVDVSSPAQEIADQIGARLSAIAD